MNYFGPKGGTARVMPSSGAAQAAEYFEHFMNATSMKNILGYYRSMCELLRLRPNLYPLFYPKLKASLNSWKAKALWKKLDSRAVHKCYGKGKIGANSRVLIIGAGPCGLRTAIEAQLLGAKVVVVEKRDRFSRNNVLHLWPFVIEDLRMLGAKKFFGKFCAGAIDHISIRQLQCILMKVALLLGVEIHTEVSFLNLIEPNSHDKTGWKAEVKPPDHPVAQYEFDVIIGADGKRNTLQGFTRKEFRGKLAIAITANFINKRTEAEARVEEISGVAFIFNQKFFKDLMEATRIDLENIVYYKDDTHYFVMTAKKASLLEKGVIKQDLADTERLLAPDNVNREALLNYAKEAAEFSTNYQMPNLEFAVNHYGQADVAMFDFTSMYAAENASKVIEKNGYRLLMILVGDSLLEPFWPTGSGCARGFLSSLDAAWAIKSWSQGANPLDVLAERESIYRLLAQTTPDNLNKDWKSYTLDPATRYPNLNKNVVMSHQLISLYDTDNPKSIERNRRNSEEGFEMPKKRRRANVDNEVLVNWAKDQVRDYEDISVTDLASVFREGKVLCAIINHYRPDLLDYGPLKENDASVNNQMAIDILDREIGINPIMTGEEMTNSEDFLSLATYLTQVYDTFRCEIPHIRHPKLRKPHTSMLIIQTHPKPVKSPNDPVKVTYKIQLSDSNELKTLFPKQRVCIKPNELIRQRNNHLMVVKKSAKARKINKHLKCKVLKDIARNLKKDALENTPRKNISQYAEKHSSQYAEKIIRQYAEKNTSQHAERNTLRYADKNASQYTQGNCSQYAAITSHHAEKHSLKYTEENTRYFWGNTCQYVEKNFPQFTEKKPQCAEKNHLQYAKENTSQYTGENTSQYAGGNTSKNAGENTSQNAGETSSQYAGENTPQYPERNTLNYAERNISKYDKNASQYFKKNSAHADKHASRYPQKRSLLYAEKNTPRYIGKNPCQYVEKLSQNVRKHPTQYALKNCSGYIQKKPQAAADNASQDAEKHSLQNVEENTNFSGGNKRYFSGENTGHFYGGNAQHFSGENTGDFFRQNTRHFSAANTSQYAEKNVAQSLRDLNKNLSQSVLKNCSQYVLNNRSEYAEKILQYSNNEIRRTRKNCSQYTAENSSQYAEKNPSQYAEKNPSQYVDKDVSQYADKNTIKFVEENAIKGNKLIAEETANRVTKRASEGCIKEGAKAIKKQTKYLMKIDQVNINSDLKLFSFDPNTTIVPYVLPIETSENSLIHFSCSFLDDRIRTIDDYIMFSEKLDAVLRERISSIKSADLGLIDHFKPELVLSCQSFNILVDYLESLRANILRSSRSELTSVLEKPSSQNSDSRDDAVRSKCPTVNEINENNLNFLSLCNMSDVLDDCPVDSQQAYFRVSDWILSNDFDQYDLNSHAENVPEIETNIEEGFSDITSVTKYLEKRRNGKERQLIVDKIRVVEKGASRKIRNFGSNRVVKALTKFSEYTPFLGTVNMKNNEEAANPFTIIAEGEETELPEVKKSDMTFKTTFKSIHPITQPIPGFAAPPRPLPGSAPRPLSRHKRHAEATLPVKLGSAEKKTRKRRTLEKVGLGVEERQKILEEIAVNRNERISKRRQQRKLQTEQFIKSMQMLQANAKPDHSEPFEDYSLFVYRQTAPNFEDRVKNLEKKFTYIPDHDAKQPSQSRGNTDDDFQARIKNIEDRWREPQSVDKKPKDLLRAIGKIETSDWNIQEIEKKIRENKLGKTSSSNKDKEKVPKWSKEQFLARQTKMEKQHLDRQDSAEAKFADIDKNIKHLELKLKEGTSLDLGKNKVATITEKLACKKPEEPKPIQKSSSKPAFVLPTQGGSEYCHFCNKRVYLMERLSAEGRFFHHGCFKCQYCHTQLRLGSYAFDKDGMYGHRFFCLHHYGMQGELPINKVTRKPSQRQPRSPEKKLPTGVTGVDLLDRVQTPERIEFSNPSVSRGSSDHEETLSQMDEDEWTDRNFGASTAEYGSSDESSSCSESSDDDDAYEEAMEEPATREGTMKWAERFKKRYSKKKHSSDSEKYSSSDQSSYYENTTDDDDSETATEDEEEIRARELRKQEVKLKPPILQPDTGTDTEVVSDESSSESSEEVLNSATEISTDSEFAHDDLTPTRETPSKLLNDSKVTKFRGSSNTFKKLQVKTAYVDKRVNGRFPKKDVELKLTPLVPSTVIRKPTPQLLPREGYALNRTQSTGGIAAKVSLELKKKYLLGETNVMGSIQKSGSASTLDSKLKTFHSNISDCQKLLKPAPEISASMQTFCNRLDEQLSPSANARVPISDVFKLGHSETPKNIPVVSNVIATPEETKGIAEDVQETPQLEEVFRFENVDEGRPRSPLHETSIVVPKINWNKKDSGSSSESDQSNSPNFKYENIPTVEIHEAESAVETQEDAPFDSLCIVTPVSEPQSDAPKSIASEKKSLNQPKLLPDPSSLECSHVQLETNPGETHVKLKSTKVEAHSGRSSPSLVDSAEQMTVALTETELSDWARDSDVSDEIGDFGLNTDEERGIKGKSATKLAKVEFDEVKHICGRSTKNAFNNLDSIEFMDTGTESSSDGGALETTNYVLFRNDDDCIAEDSLNPVIEDVLEAKNIYINNSGNICMSDSKHNYTKVNYKIINEPVVSAPETRNYHISVKDSSREVDSNSTPKSQIEIGEAKDEVFKEITDQNSRRDAKIENVDLRKLDKNPEVKETETKKVQDAEESQDVKTNKADNAEKNMNHQQNNMIKKTEPNPNGNTAESKEVSESDQSNNFGANVIDLKPEDLERLKQKQLTTENEDDSLLILETETTTEENTCSDSTVKNVAELPNAKEREKAKSLSDSNNFQRQRLEGKLAQLKREQALLKQNRLEKELKQKQLELEVASEKTGEKTEEPEYQEHCQRLQSKVEFGNAKDSIDIRKSRRKSKSDSPNKPDLIQEEKDDSADLTNLIIKTPDIIYKKEIIEKERDVNQRLVQEMVMNKMKAENKSLERKKRQRNSPFELSRSATTDIVLQINKNNINENQKRINTPDVLLTSRPLQKSQTLTAVANDDPQVNTNTPLGENKIRPLSVFSTFSSDSNRLSESDWQLSTFITPKAPPRSKHEEAKRTAEKLKDDARARARLLSNEQLGLSPEEKIQKLRERARRGKENSVDSHVQESIESLVLNTEKRNSLLYSNDTLSKKKNGSFRRSKSGDDGERNLHKYSADNILQARMRKSDPTHEDEKKKAIKSFQSDPNLLDTEGKNKKKSKDRERRKSIKFTKIMDLFTKRSPKGLFSKISPKTKAVSKSCIALDQWDYPTYQEPSRSKSYSEVRPIQTPPPVPPLPANYTGSSLKDDSSDAELGHSRFKGDDNARIPRYSSFGLSDNSSDGDNLDLKKFHDSSCDTLEKSTSFDVPSSRRSTKGHRRAARQAQLKRHRMAQEIQRKLEETEVKTKELEERGVMVEKALRGEDPRSVNKEETELLQEWFDLMRDRTELRRYERELMVRAQELELEDRHARLQQELRERLENNDQKTEEDVAIEGSIINEMLEIVSKRDSLIALLEEDRLRYSNEDRDFEEQMLAKGLRLTPLRKASETAN